MENNRNSFSSSFGFVIASAASAIGLGNIWRFPYLAAKDGGGVFLLVYIILVGWILKPKAIIDEITRNGESFARKNLYVVMVKYVAPVLLTILLLGAFGVF